MFFFVQFHKNLKVPFNYHIFQVSYINTENKMESKNYVLFLYNKVKPKS